MAINKQQAQVIIDELGRELACGIYTELVQIANGEKTYADIKPETAAGIWPALGEALYMNN
jgi:hypothetical protein